MPKIVEKKPTMYQRVYLNDNQLKEVDVLMEKYKTKENLLLAKKAIRAVGDRWVVLIYDDLTSHLSLSPLKGINYPTNTPYDFWMDAVAQWEFWKSGQRSTLKLDDNYQMSAEIDDHELN